MKNYKSLTQKYNAKRKQNNDNLRIYLINKLKEVTEERRNLSLLLAAAVCENRTIRTYYRLESMAKTRLALHMEQTKKKIKESQLQYVNFQHLYLMTQQENMYLKALIKKLTKQKEDAERNLISLVHEVCLTKNKKLMAYCSRFVVQTKDKLLCSDMSAEIKQFLTSTNSVHCSKSYFKQEVASNTKNSTRNQTSEEEKHLMPLLSTSGPRLVGLPGEHIWTIKDKDGFIEKLYEYDFEPNFDNGDTIRRIREYSVYHDKDCFLENFQ
ncbi:unnamed protein product [Parnassius apollo]|uniref:(apollo) hypothetical protein n=1 Tax=Parnassius apollo TaxID=110799 RepID=A0A8S3X9K3_PARAO|nr:unnamed protein product [Parnassius apollo]